MRRLRMMAVIVALAAVVGVGGTAPPVAANELTVQMSAKHSQDGFGSQGAEAGTITVVTGADPLGVAPFHISMTCSNGVTEEWDLPAETEIIAYTTTAADGANTVICQVTQADTVVYETAGAEQSSSTSCFPGIPCTADHSRITFINQVPPVPSITVTKQTNGVDAETPADAVLLDRGDEVVWTYAVTNSGDYTVLGDTVEVVDDVEGPVSCTLPDQMLPGETATCDPIVGIADDADGAYANTVTVTGEAVICGIVCPPEQVVDTDVSHYALRAVDPTTSTTPDSAVAPGTAAPATPIAADARFAG